MTREIWGDLSRKFICYNTTDMSQRQPRRNPTTRKIHRRQTLWQIVLPLLVGILIVLALAVWAGLTTTQGGSVRRAADASLIFMLLPVIVLTFLALVVLISLVYLVTQLASFLPPKIFTVQKAFQRLQAGTKMWSDRAVQPSLWLGSRLATWRALKRVLLKRKR